MRKSNHGTEYHIKWEDYDETTWEPSKNIPKCIRDFYAETGDGKLPPAKVKESTKHGNLHCFPETINKQRNNAMQAPQCSMTLSGAKMIIFLCGTATSTFISKQRQSLYLLARASLVTHGRIETRGRTGILVEYSSGNYVSIVAVIHEHISLSVWPASF